VFKFLLSGSEHLRLRALVVTAFFGLLLPLVANSAQAQSGEACGVGKGGHPLVQRGNSCVDLTPPSEIEQEIRAAKHAAATAFAENSSSDSSNAALAAAELRLEMLSGESISPRRSVPGTNRQTERLLGSGLDASFWPFSQIYGYYCGPATAQSMLWFLGGGTTTTSATYDTQTGAYDQLNANSSHDQPILGNSFWLATDTYGGTNWGSLYLPFTLNSWRGTSYYAGEGAANVGGSLTQATAHAYVFYDTVLDYPVAENVLYLSGVTFNPQGFLNGVRYEHWDTLYGFATSGGIEYAKVGQVYGASLFDGNAPTQGQYQQYQAVPWNTQWGAIAVWNGIVW
jgi:hypothetical protein